MSSRKKMYMLVSACALFSACNLFGGGGCLRYEENASAQPSPKISRPIPGQRTFEWPESPRFPRAGASSSTTINTSIINNNLSNSDIIRPDIDIVVPPLAAQIVAVSLLLAKEDTLNPACAA